MSGRQRRYEAKIVWTGAEAGPAKDVRTFSREYRIEMPGKVAICGSSDPAFRGDPALHNPEDLLVAPPSPPVICCGIWPCARPRGSRCTPMRTPPKASWSPSRATAASPRLPCTPRWTIGADDDTALALALHERAHAECFVANSVNFPVRYDAKIAAPTAEQAWSAALPRFPKRAFPPILDWE